MSRIRIMSREDIVKVLSMKATIDAVEAAYRSKATGEGVIWPLITYEFDPGHADLDIKSGWISSEGIYGVKLVSWFGDNPKVGLPALYGTTMLFDGSNGRPIGLLDAEYIIELAMVFWELFMSPSPTASYCEVNAESVIVLLGLCSR